MTQSEIIELIRAAHRYASPQRPEVTEAIAIDASLVELGIESIAAFEMLGFIEQRLAVEFEVGELAALRTVQSIVELVQSHDHPQQH
jgi:acyl carrier protein